MTTPTPSHFACPACRTDRAFVNAGQAHIGYCPPCGVSWRIGSNLFSSWRDETEQEQRAAYADAGIASLHRIEP